MSFIQTIITAVICVALLALIVFPELRQKGLVLVRGIANTFVEDQAKTPEGAKAIFTQAISEAEENYQKAKEVYNRLSGRERRLRDEVIKLNENIKMTEARVESFARRGDRENAKLYAEQVMQLKSAVKAKEQSIAVLAPSVAKAKQAFDVSSKRVTDLKAQKQNVVTQMETNRMTKELMDDLDDVYKNSATDKMLDAVLEGAGVLMEESSGAIATHEAKTSTRIERAEAIAREAESEAYLDNIMKKYSGGK